MLVDEEDNYSAWSAQKGPVDPLSIATPTDVNVRELPLHLTSDDKTSYATKIDRNSSLMPRDKYQFKESNTSDRPKSTEFQYQHILSHRSHDSSELLLSPQRAIRGSLVDHMLLSFDKFHPNYHHHHVLNPEIHQSYSRNISNHEPPFIANSSENNAYDTGTKPNFNNQTEIGGEQYNASVYDKYEYTNTFDAGRRPLVRARASNPRVRVMKDYVNCQRPNSQTAYRYGTPPHDKMQVITSQMTNVIGAKGSSVDLGFRPPSNNQKSKPYQIARSTSFDLGSDYHSNNLSTNTWSQIREPSSHYNLVPTSPSKSLRRKITSTPMKMPHLDPITPLTPIDPGFITLEHTRKVNSSLRHRPRRTYSMENKNIRDTPSYSNDTDPLAQSGSGSSKIQSCASPQNSVLSKNTRIAQVKGEKEVAAMITTSISSGSDILSPNQTKERPGFFRRVFGSSKNLTGNNTNTATNTNYNNHDQNLEQSPPHGSSPQFETTDRSKPKSRLINSQLKQRLDYESTPSAPSSIKSSPVSTLPPQTPLVPALAISSLTHASNTQPPMDSLHQLNKKPSSLFRRRKKLSSKCPQSIQSLDPINSHHNVKSDKLHQIPPSKSPVSLHSHSQNLKPALEPLSQSEFEYEKKKLNTSYVDGPSTAVFLSSQDVTSSSVYKAPNTCDLNNSQGFSTHHLSTMNFLKGHRRSRSQTAGYESLKSDRHGTSLYDNSDNERGQIHPKTGLMKPHTSDQFDVNVIALSEKNYASESALRINIGGDEIKDTLWDRSPQIPPHHYLNDHILAIRKAHIARKQSEDWIKITRTKSPTNAEKEDRLWLEPSSDEESSPSQLGAGETIFFDTRNNINRSTTSLREAAIEDKNVEQWETSDREKKPLLRVGSSLSLSASKDTPLTKHNSHELDIARQIYDGISELVPKHKAAAWLGEEEDGSRSRILQAYLQLFNFTNLNILAALRMLCSRLILKAESQQVDRIIEAFSKRWTECNPSHAFKFRDVVHTICYSLLLLNTDLHLAEIEQKMTRSQFVKNTMPTIRKIISDSSPDDVESGNQVTKSERISLDIEKPSWRSSIKPSSMRIDGGSLPPTPLDFETPLDDSGPLVRNPFRGTMRTWEVQVEIILKGFYTSIRNEPLPLYGSTSENTAIVTSRNSTLSANSSGILRRTPSVHSHTPSDAHSYKARTIDSLRIANGMRSSKNRSRPRLHPPPSGFGSSRTSLDEPSPMWSPNSSILSKYSLGKTLTSNSVDSWGSGWPNEEYQQSIGFANAINQAIIREENITCSNSTNHDRNESGMLPGLEDESLELHGAPWAKEGIVQHKHHLESVDKKARERNWTEVFAVIEKGYLSIFSFSSKSLRHKPKGGGGAKPNQGTVGGGNWQENARNLGSFILQQTIASALPSPGYSATRPHVWALSLPTGAVHFFQVGTPDIVREFVSTANYWGARLSTHPLIGGISNIEYGWSESIINSVVDNETPTNLEITKRPTTSSRPRPSLSGRSSAPSSTRASLDLPPGSLRPRIIVDKISIADWTPPTQNMRASTASEKDQLNSLVNYVCGIEEELQKHNQLRSSMRSAFSIRHPNSLKAMANWEKKSAYLLREIVKFKTYIDILNAAEAAKLKIYSEQKDRTKEVQGEIDGKQ